MAKHMLSDFVRIPESENRYVGNTVAYYLVLLWFCNLHVNIPYKANILCLWIKILYFY